MLLNGITHLCRRQIDGIPINEWAITHKPKEFANFLEANIHKLYPLPFMGRIPNNQHFCERLKKAVAKLS